MRSVLQDTARKFKIYMADSVTPTSGKTGLTSFTVYLTKDSAAEATVAPTIVECGHGFYEVTPLTSHRDTLGESSWVFVASGAIDYPMKETVEAVDAQAARYGASAAGDAMTLAAGQRVKLDATQPDYAPAKSGDAMTLDSAVLTALFADVDTAALVASIVEHFDEATDLPTDTIATLAATRTVAALATAISNIAAAKTAAEAVQAKLPTTSHLAGAATNAGAAVLDSDAQDAIAEKVATLLGDTHGAGSWEGGGEGGAGGLTEDQATQLTEIHEAIYPEDPDDPPVVVTPAVGDNTTGYTTTLDADLEVQPDVTVKIQLIQLPSAAGITNSNAVRSVVSSDVGLAQMPLRKGATYRIWAGGDDKNVEVVTVPADAGGTYQLPSLVGRF